MYLTGDLNIGILDENDRKYPMEGLEEFNTEKIKEFIDDYDVGMYRNRGSNVI